MLKSAVRNKFHRIVREFSPLEGARNFPSGNVVDFFLHTFMQFLEKEIRG